MNSTSYLVRIERPSIGFDTVIYLPIWSLIQGGRGDCIDNNKFCVLLNLPVGMGANGTWHVCRGFNLLVMMGNYSAFYAEARGSVGSNGLFVTISIFVYHMTSLSGLNP